MNKTGINWCDRTWNPMTGCKHGCSYCYARRLAEGRLKRSYPEGFTGTTFHEDRLDQPSRTKKPSVIFVGSMTDMMGEWWTNDDINAVIEECYQNKQHTFLWLTKVPGRYGDFVWPDNCWLGTTVTGPDDLWRVAALVRVPGVKRFLSLEPMLAAVDLTDINNETVLDPECWGDCDCDGLYGYDPGCRRNGGDGTLERRIHQVILGPENGPSKRPMEDQWALDVEEQCRAAGVPFFRKDQGRGDLAWKK